MVAPHVRRVAFNWSSQLAALGPLTSGAFARAPLDFTELAAALRHASYPEFSKRIREFGSHLARRGVRIERAAAALNRLFEICLGVLRRRRFGRASPALALARLKALVEVLLVSGYADYQTGRRQPVELELPGNRRRRADSASITRIYEQERRRLSRDLHDEVGHDLTLLKLHLERMVAEEKKQKVRTTRGLREAIALVSHAIEAVRRLASDLGPAIFEHVAFLPAIRLYLKRFSERTDIEVRLRQSKLPREIPTPHEVTLYRVLQSALSNVLQHAAARNVIVSLTAGNGSRLRMVVEDDGVGFNTAAMRDSFGLKAMRERVELLGGEIQVSSRPVSASRVKNAPRARRSGTRIAVDLPLPASSNA